MSDRPAVPDWALPPVIAGQAVRPPTSPPPPSSPAGPPAPPPVPRARGSAFGVAVAGVLVTLGIAWTAAGLVAPTYYGVTGADEFADGAGGSSLWLENLAWFVCIVCLAIGGVVTVRLTKAKRRELAAAPRAVPDPRVAREQSHQVLAFLVATVILVAGHLIGTWMWHELTELFHPGGSDAFYECLEQHRGVPIVETGCEVNPPARGAIYQPLAFVAWFLCVAAAFGLAVFTTRLIRSVGGPVPALKKCVELVLVALSFAFAIAVTIMIATTDFV